MTWVKVDNEKTQCMNLLKDISKENSNVVLSLFLTLNNVECEHIRHSNPFQANNPINTPWKTPENIKLLFSTGIKRERLKWIKC